MGRGELGRHPQRLLTARDDCLTVELFIYGSQQVTHRLTILPVVGLLRHRLRQHVLGFGDYLPQTNCFLSELSAVSFIRWRRSSFEVVHIMYLPTVKTAICGKATVFYKREWCTFIEPDTQDCTLYYRIRCCCLHQILQPWSVVVVILDGFLRKYCEVDIMALKIERKMYPVKGQ